MREKGRNAQEAEKTHPSKITAAVSWSDAVLLIFFCIFSKDDGIFCHSSSSLVGSLFLSQQILAFYDDRLLQTQPLIMEAGVD